MNTAPLQIETLTGWYNAKTGETPRGAGVASTKQEQTAKEKCNYKQQDPHSAMVRVLCFLPVSLR
jgi:hypothetical protein